MTNGFQINIVFMVLRKRNFTYAINGCVDACKLNNFSPNVSGNVSLKIMTVIFTYTKGRETERDFPTLSSFKTEYCETLQLATASLGNSLGS